ncbi:MAG TPA: hypothetical protein VF763_12450 [Candidatus Limnocylindrales bacterium]
MISSRTLDGRIQRLEYIPTVLLVTRSHREEDIDWTTVRSSTARGPICTSAIS